MKVLRKSRAETNRSEQLLFAISMLIEVYLALILCVYPFLMKAGYGETSFIKYNFLVGISYAFKIGPLPVPTFVPVTLVLAAVWFVTRAKEEKKSLRDAILAVRLSLTDKTVLLYTLSLVLSSVVSSYKSELIWGYPGWNMGLASQFLFVYLYFICSRFFDPADLRFFTYASMAASSGVFLIAILQRLGMDVLHLYTDGINRVLFLSTIGQASWFSSYMILFVSFGAFLVWYVDKTSLLYKCGIAYLVTGSVCLVTQNTDSAYAGIFFALSVLFVCSFDSVKRMRRFLETALIILLGFRLAGVLRLMAKDRAILLDPLSEFMMNSAWIWLLIGILVLFYLWVRRMPDGKNPLDAGRLRAAGTVYVCALAAAVFLLALYIMLNTGGHLPEALSSTRNYFYFNLSWGNGRGATLHDTVLSFLAQLRAEPLKGIFGAGADQFYHVIQTYVSDWTSSMSSGVLTNAHNEWLTAFVNFGLSGGAVYLLIFLSAVVRGIRNRGDVPYAPAVSACVAAYLAHNLFCYQQYICTPYVFIIMGVGETLLSRDRSLHGSDDVIRR